ncbi:helicase-exonuclease AddAB subunit AddB [Xylanibacillus composti]|uniref:ATP-dependent helicase/deoxyribonuclease subunit B n=1 Tax=Xylanibacillus composti TaxID=1572762 RepID=A0A8J4H6D6_9BACL|nr:helicase-exonuclease AddAB subunit AddB [Xylanibacillus composti]MDT9724437.1 helicase-exonuclease AddAB subunit AddB [Xylanibacillus composti]GIQ69699.1 ATP-dependent helicase/deoxyribonuclease subunit B [Xylanibacillus composti]
MAVQLIIGRAGSGKSRYCLEQIREGLRRDPAGQPIVLLVPEQASFSAEKALAATPGLHGVIRAQVLSFRRMAFRIMQETGGMAKPPIGEMGKKLLLYSLMQKRKDELRALRAQADQVAYTEKLLQFITECKRYEIGPAELEAHLQEAGLAEGAGGRDFAAKLGDLALLYADYEAAVKERYLDTEDALELLAEKLPESVYARQMEVWIDGFNGFTPQEYRVLGQLFRVCRQVTITLSADRDREPGEQPEELDLFHPTAVTLLKLKQLAEDCGAELGETRRLEELRGEAPAMFPHRHADNPVLAHLERHYASRRKWTDRDTYETGKRPESAIVVAAAVNRRAEVEGIAREMLRLARECGYRWRDMAVLLRHPATYEELISLVFGDYGIPHFLDRKQTAVHHPLLEFIRSSLETALHFWPYEAVFRCAKTGFFGPVGEHAELTYRQRMQQHREALDRLENYVLAFGLQGAAWLDDKPWVYRLRYSLEDEDAEQDRYDLNEIHALRMAIAAPLRQFQERLTRASCVREQAEAVFALLEDAAIPTHLAQWSEQAVRDGRPERAREHTQVWDGVIDMLEQMVDATGQEAISSATFADWLQAGLDQVKLALVPPSLDEVLVGSMERTRPGSVRAVFVPGANDGVLPARPAEDSVITEHERDLLADGGLALAPGSKRKLLDEQFLIYSTLSVPSDKLWLSYPVADEEGKALTPSEVVRRVKGMFPTLPAVWLGGEPEPAMPEDEQLTFIQSPERAAAYLVNQIRHWLGGTPIAEGWWDVYAWHLADPSRRLSLQTRLGGLFFTNREEAISGGTAKQLYGERLKASVSRMEKHAACPFAQFAAYGLRLEERAVYRLEAPDIGQFFHAALSWIAGELLAAGKSWSELGDEDCERMAERAVAHLTPRLQSEILLSSHRYRYMARKLKDIISRTTAMLAVQAARGEFTPAGLEIPFGRKGRIPPLRFTLADGTEMEVAGRIDRVDQAERDGALLLRVIDYKSGSVQLNMAEVYYGLSLQLLAYLDVAVSNAEEWLGRPAEAAGAFYVHVHNPIVAFAGPVEREKARKEALKRFKQRGLVMGRSDVIQAMDRTLDSGYSDIIPVRLKTSGDIVESQSSTFLPEQWPHLRKAVRRRMHEIGASIAGGEVAIAPYRLGTKTPCGFCPYKSVCQFDPLYAGNAYNQLNGIGKSDVWRKLEEEGMRDE